MSEPGRPRCVVCGTDRHDDLMRVGLDGPAGVICRRDYAAAMRRCGPPRRCAVVACTQCGAHSVTAVWPLFSANITDPAIRLCRRDLADTIAALAAEHAAATQGP